MYFVDFMRVTPSQMRFIRIFFPAAYVVGSAIFFVACGVPYARIDLAVWLLLGLACFSITDLRGYVRGLLFDWFPFFGILVAYDLLRGTASHITSVHFRPMIDLDRLLFGGQIPTVTLQRWLWNGHVHWYDIASWTVYMSHFFLTPVLAAILWKVNRERFRRFTRLVIALSIAGLTTYALFPAAPPWLASKDHMVAPLTRIIPQVWKALPLSQAGTIAENGYAFANNVAAVPSLHAAFSLLVAITLWQMTSRRWLKALIALYPLAMAFAVIYTGEHYVTDVLLGWTYTSAIVFAWSRGASRIAAWQAARQELEPATTPRHRVPAPERAPIPVTAFSRQPD
jgi:PAP2 superfamily protein